MGVFVASNTTFSVAANAKSADQVDGEFEFIGKGNISLSALSSATGLNVSLKVGGITIIDDKPIPFFGTTGGMKILDNILVNQAVNGGRIELFFRNTTAGALTVDYVVQFEPTR
jgi:hypothetical protein